MAPAISPDVLGFDHRLIAERRPKCPAGANDLPFLVGKRVQSIRIVFSVELP
jgi:hypothetical protein